MAAGISPVPRGGDIQGRSSSVLIHYFRIVQWDLLMTFSILRRAAVKHAGLVPSGLRLCCIAPPPQVWGRRAVSAARCVAWRRHCKCWAPLKRTQAACVWFTVGLRAHATTWMLGAAQRRDPRLAWKERRANASAWLRQKLFRNFRLASAQLLARRYLVVRRRLNFQPILARRCDTLACGSVGIK
jgi:hypothetical protein